MAKIAHVQLHKACVKYTVICKLRDPKKKKKPTHLTIRVQSTLLESIMRYYFSLLFSLKRVHSYIMYNV